jgi:aldehyde dehydrogenase (NAD+)
MSTSTAALLAKLHLQADNAGVCHGPGASYNPTTGAAIARVIPADRAAYDATVAAAQAGFARWRTVPAPKRGEVVRDLGNLLRAYKEPLGELVTLEMGKIRAEGHGRSAGDDRHLRLRRRPLAPALRADHALRAPGHRMYEQWHPLGPIGIITAFNFPVAVWSWNAAIAAVCGDTLVWKPSELVPAHGRGRAAHRQPVMADHGLTGVFTLAVGAGDVGRWMAEDARLPLVSFTGSIPTGRRVAQTVAGRLGRTMLELGGNNAIIVADKADLTWRRAPSSLARWARPGSAAPRRGASSCTPSRGELNSAPAGEGLWPGGHRRPAARAR